MASLPGDLRSCPEDRQSYSDAGSGSDQQYPGVLAGSKRGPARHTQTPETFAREEKACLSHPRLLLGWKSARPKCARSSANSTPRVRLTSSECARPLLKRSKWPTSRFEVFTSGLRAVISVGSIIAECIRSFRPIVKFPRKT